MSTIRKWLDGKGFDWESGTIIWHKTEGILEDPEGYHSAGWDEALDALIIQHDHPVLDYEFDNGYGGPECPRFVAKDKDRIFFPWQYDGATGIDFVLIDLNKYLDFENNPTPYPGGG